jgi:hypothetical protein
MAIDGKNLSQVVAKPSPHPSDCNFGCKRLRSIVIRLYLVPLLLLIPGLEAIHLSARQVRNNVACYLRVVRFRVHRPPICLSVPKLLSACFFLCVQRVGST